MRRAVIGWVWITLVMAPVALAWAQATGPAAGNPPDQQAAAPAAPQDRFAVPEGGVEELVKFLQELRSIRPSSQAELLELRQKLPTAIKTAATKILKLEKDKTSEAYQLASRLLLELRVGSLPSAQADEKEAVLKELKDWLTQRAKTGFSPSDIGLASSAARVLEFTGDTQKAAQVYEDYGKLFAASSDPRIVEVAGSFQGSARRLRLPGNLLELKGKLLDGTELDWKSYRGKVVLIDFWATWCGPCRAEMPNVRRYLDLYRDRGFEVIGISLDESREALEAFLEQEELPWITLFDEQAKGAHPMAEYYGIMSIPTVILVDKEGKVVSLEARGPELGRLLAKLLGPVDESEPKAGEAAKPGDAG